MWAMYSGDVIKLSCGFPIALLIGSLHIVRGGEGRGGGVSRVWGQ